MKLICLVKPIGPLGSLPVVCSDPSILLMIAFFDSVDKFETPEPIRKKPTKEKTEEGSETRSCLSCLLSWLSGITALVLMMFILLLLGGGMHKRISPEL